MGDNEYKESDYVRDPEKNVRDPNRDPVVDYSTETLIKKGIILSQDALNRRSEASWARSRIQGIPTDFDSYMRKAVDRVEQAAPQNPPAETLSPAEETPTEMAAEAPLADKKGQAELGKDFLDAIATPMRLFGTLKE